MQIPDPIVQKFIRKSAALLQINPTDQVPSYLRRRVATEEILCASSIHFSKDSLRYYRNYEVFPDLDSVALLYLKSFPICTTITAENYDQNQSFSSALTTIDRDFEFPTWDGRLVSEFLSIKTKGLTILSWMQSIRVRFEDVSGDAIESDPKIIPIADFYRLEPFSDNGWAFPSGEKIYLRFLR